MSIKDICNLPIVSVLADDSFLFVWAVNRFIAESVQLVSDWACTYSFTMAWVKSKASQLPNGPRFNSELCIVGRKGSPQFLDTKAFQVANIWPWSGHSEKPEGFYDLLRRVTPGPRLDVFGRKRIECLECWGNEAPEGPSLPDHYQIVMA